MSFKFLPAVIFVIVCEAVGILGSLFTAPAIPAWYAGLNKPSFSPPNWLFAPVWTILYALMGISAFLIWRERFERKDAKVALVLFAVQLILNTSWSFLFFKLQNPFYALVEIFVLWVFILLTILSFSKISKPAGLLLLPYLLWTTFASLLNFYIFKLNR